MKKYLSLLILPLLFLQAHAGGNDKYVKAMEQAISIMDTASKVETYREVSNRFERIGNAEKKEWLPWYYAAFCNAMISFIDQDPEAKDPVLDKAEEYLKKAEDLVKKEDDRSEIEVVRGMIYGGRIQVDPQTRGMQYGPMAGMAYRKALALDERNPRAIFYTGQNLMFTPEAFGGGKEKAIPVMEDAMEAYDSYEPKSSIHPNWGKEYAEGFLKWAKEDGKMPWMEEEKNEKEDQEIKD